MKIVISTLNVISSLTQVTGYRHFVILAESVRSTREIAAILVPVERTDSARMTKVVCFKKQLATWVN